MRWWILALVRRVWTPNARVGLLSTALLFSGTLAGIASGLDSQRFLAVGSSAVLSTFWCAWFLLREVRSAHGRGLSEGKTIGVKVGREIERQAISFAERRKWTQQRKEN